MSTTWQTAVTAPSVVTDDQPKVRVLVVDDSVVTRLLVAEAVRSSPTLEVAALVPDGRTALDKIADLDVDVVVLDVEMPGLDGLATLALLRKADRGLPVVMFSTQTSRGARATVEALSLGASDYVQKPSTSGREDTLAVLAQELVPKLGALGGPRARRRTQRPGKAVRALPSYPLQPPSARPAPVRCVVIGVSTGGPNALAQLVPQLPADLPVPVLVVQHMPAMFTAMLAERLDKASPLRVREAQGGEPLLPGHLYVAPGGRHLAVRPPRGELPGFTRLLDTEPENSCRPAVDVLFRSAVTAYGGGVLAVVLTGMGKDGYAGAHEVVGAGGQVLAQDEASSVVWGMPRYVAEGGLAQAVVPLERVAAEVLARLR